MGLTARTDSTRDKHQIKSNLDAIWRVIIFVRTKAVKRPLLKSPLGIKCGQKACRQESPGKNVCAFFNLQCSLPFGVRVWAKRARRMTLFCTIALAIINEITRVVIS